MRSAAAITSETRVNNKPLAMFYSPPIKILGYSFGSINSFVSNSDGEPALLIGDVA